ncbi:hypothetical protein H310_08054 [Aphanomyces invadans]|uniref:N-acetyltransferase domain-containing protein n=1 Tax=Aphanomyces invadans TaxID=157072 RepID=A0A024U0C0_9STRA|nr:hypothetical protein H310_08054 [Aphanomyces invadans]ETV99326.1 hypothetical protein H310_08054 [Aphanomyces invadans]|eukprot:XP_008871882.1 hypothetical protein H310_08054 [Aphanomyces invadans]
MDEVSARNNVANMLRYPLELAVSEPGFSYVLMPWMEAMAPALTRHANDELVAKYLTPAFPHPYTLENAFSYIAYAQHTTDEAILAIVRVDNSTLEREAIGSIGVIFDNDSTGKFGYWLGRLHWGKGIASAATRAFLEDLAANNHRELKRVEASVYVANVASQRVLEKNGFRWQRVEPTLPYRDGGALEANIFVKAIGDGPL